MSFSTRNAYYLRASNYRVIPLFLYLDERHVDWMSDKVLQLVIAELKPKMANLLMFGKAQKKHKVYVERGEGYQYCYFLRTTTKTEVVLLKQKTFTLRAPSPPPPLPPSSPTRKNKRKSSSSMVRSSVGPRPSPSPTSSRSRSRSRSRSITARPNYDEREETPLSGLDDDAIQVKTEVDEDDVQMSFGTGRGGDEDDEDNGEKGIKNMKPDVDVTYKGFGTSSLQLVLIIEPYPPLPASSYAPPSSRLSSRSTSLAHTTAAQSRSRSRQQGTGLDLNVESTPLNSRNANSRSRYSTGIQDDRSSVTPNNMRNPSLTPVIPNSRRGGTKVRDESSTPGPSGSGSSSSRRGGSGAGGVTPLFLSRETPFDYDEEDEEEHEAYEAALREGRLRLPSVLDEDDDDNTIGDGGSGAARSRSRSRSRYSKDDDDDEATEDIPEDMVSIGERLVRSSEISEGVVGVKGGWEEMGQGEESAVMGREEPGD